MSKENQTEEKELRKKISSTQGTDCIETYVELGQLAYDRGDHTAFLLFAKALAKYIKASQLTLIDHKNLRWSLN